MEITIRKISKEDVTHIAVLCSQLGYPLSLEQVIQNMNDVMSNKDHDAFVAVHQQLVIGWIGVSNSIKIEMPPYCEVHGLVIDDHFRGHGVGKMLLEKAKEWAREKGHDRLALHCNVNRTETLLFYDHLGFREVKQQKFLEIEI